MKYKVQVVDKNCRRITSDDSNLGIRVEVPSHKRMVSLSDTHCTANFFLKLPTMHFYTFLNGTQRLNDYVDSHSSVVFVFDNQYYYPVLPNIRPHGERLDNPLDICGLYQTVKIVRKYSFSERLRSLFGYISKEYRIVRCNGHICAPMKLEEYAINRLENFFSTAFSYDLTRVMCYYDFPHKSKATIYGFFKDWHEATKHNLDFIVKSKSRPITGSDKLFFDSYRKAINDEI